MRTCVCLLDVTLAEKPGAAAHTFDPHVGQTQMDSGGY